MAKKKRTRKERQDELHASLSKIVAAARLKHDDLARELEAINNVLANVYAGPEWEVKAKALIESKEPKKSKAKPKPKPKEVNGDQDTIQSEGAAGAEQLPKAGEA